MEAAQYEHHDIDVLKHLLTTASFAKKFCDPTEFDPNRYVDLVKHSIVLTKMRNSPNFARAITFAQLKQFKPKNIIKLLLKFRDYRLAILVIEQLNLKNLSIVYEDWCTQMLKHSTQKDLEHVFEDKFEELASKLAIDQGISFSDVERARRERQQANSMMGSQDQVAQKAYLNSNTILGQVKLGIDFTKLAKLAHHSGKTRLSEYLIGYEKQIVKKIPFLL